MKKFKSFAAFLDGLKNRRKSLIFLIGLDIFLAIGSGIADWPWIMSVVKDTPHLLPFMPICSLYPMTLAIWFTLYYFKKRIPGWYTAFIFMGIVSYGLMAWIYYPAYIAWDGMQWRLYGNMAWVSIYALQSFIIASELKKLPWYQYSLIFAYFGFKDYADRYLGTFIDVRRTDFPEDLKITLWAVIITLHILAAAAVILFPYFKSLKAKLPSPSFQEVR
jgi:hypothetical protein